MPLFEGVLDFFSKEYPMNILSDRTLPTPRVAAHPFTQVEWNQVLGHLAQVIGDDARRYAEVPAAKVTAAISYLSGSEDPDRFAVSNLLTFHAATRARALFNHRPSDDVDVRRRLATIQFGTLANREVVDYGMTLLSLISLSDHQHDIEEDRAIGKYNPVAEGKWDVDELTKRLEATLAKNPKLKAEFALVLGELSPMGFWSY